MALGVGRVGWRSYVAPPPTSTLYNNLIHAWNANGNANDSVGSLNGTLINGALANAAPKMGSGAFYFDRINDYISLQDNSLNLDTDFTVSFWCKDGYGGINRMIIHNCYFANDAYTSGWMILYGGNGIEVDIWNNGAYASLTTTVDSFGPIRTNWNHVTVKYTRGVKIEIFLNGVLNSTKNTTLLPSYTRTPIKTSIGSWNSLYGPTLYLGDGLLDDLNIWNRALTNSEITELYNFTTELAVAPTYTSRTTAFATATGITDTTILNALNTFDAGLISNGLDTKMKALYPFVGGTASTHKYNFMDARDVDAAYRLVFNGGWIHSSTGAKPNGTNGYADTFLNNNTMGQDNVSVGIYLGGDNIKGGGTSCAIGSWNGAGTWIYPGQNNGGAYVSINSSSSTVLNPNSDGKSRGLYLISKTTSNSFASVRGNITNTVFTTTTYGYVSTPFKLAANGAYAWGDYSEQQQRLAYIGDGLTTSEAATFYTLTQALQTSLSRQV